MRDFCRRSAVVLLCAFAALIAVQSAAFAGVRLALVLGNGKYEAVPALDNPSNDAADLAQALRGVGFEVIEQRDATRDAMAKAVREFSERLRGADVALFFYAGHGLQMNGENYLLPVDAKIESPADVRFNTINLSDIQQEMESGGSGARQYHHPRRLPQQSVRRETGEFRARHIDARPWPHRRDRRGLADRLFHTAQQCRARRRRPQFRPSPPRC